MPLSEVTIKYVVDGVAATPRVLFALLSGSPDFDRRTDPERFTLREMIAHVADWDAIFAERIERARDEDNPFLPSVDEGQLAVERGYSSQDPATNLARFSESRAKLVALLQSLQPADWDRVAHREFVGDVTMFQLAAIILGHDAYHLRQAAEFALMAGKL